jgi:hypothetical protein
VVVLAAGEGEIVFITVAVTGEGVTVTVIAREQPPKSASSTMTAKDDERILTILIPLIKHNK